MNRYNKSQQRAEIRAGLTVDIILKNDQRTGKRTRGTVKEILTNSAYHPHGIKVRLEDGRVGRVAEIIGPDNAGTG
ncbi:MAG: YwbE family protein [Methanoregula sp.]|nr:YwbE family protein [Methanoregula sp.]